MVAGLLAAVGARNPARGEPVGLVIAAGGIGLAWEGGGWHGPPADTPTAIEAIQRIDEQFRPRWVLWPGAAADRLVAAGVRLATCWHIGAADRLLAGGFRTDPQRAWGRAHDLAADAAPQPHHDLFSDAGPDDTAVRPDGYLHPSWVDGSAIDRPERAEAWAHLALELAARQADRLRAIGPRAEATARAESTTELLCAELAADGLPIDRAGIEELLGSVVGPRTAGSADAAAQRAERDDAVLRHAPSGVTADLRNPAQVRSLLRAIGVEVPDTRAWRLEGLAGTHPLVDALLTWRKAERIATTYGYGWLDEHVGPDDRLRGQWTSCDGAAGRMTASAGLHNLPAVMRSCVAAGPGHRFVQADLGQIEPRVLAAVSGDPALARASAMPDLYAPIAEQLGIDRATAKVAFLGAMYGQTTGKGAEALHRLRRAFPVAMDYLDAADRAGQAGRDLRTSGGRLVRLSGGDASPVPDREARARSAARGRYARNAMVQGAAAEFFKVWAVTVRARAADLGARIVLCLHDELIVHCPADRAAEVAAVVSRCLDEAAHRWDPTGAVRFTADTSIVERWSDAKE